MCYNLKKGGNENEEDEDEKIIKPDACLRNASHKRNERSSRKGIGY